MLYSYNPMVTDTVAVDVKSTQIRSVHIYLHLIVCYMRTWILGWGEMAQQLSTLAALPEGPRLVPTAHVR